MRQIIIILILLETVIFFGQSKVEGTFCSSSGYSSYCLTLNSDSLFSYESSGCLTKAIGSGKFKIDKNRLKLYFTKTDTAKNSFKIKSRECQNPDSITLIFVVKSFEDNAPIQNADIYFSKGEKISKNTLTDINGNATIKLKKSVSIFDINISIAMHKKVVIKATPDKCLDIETYLETSSVNYFENGEIREYEILRQTADNLSLRRNGHKTKLKRKK